MLGIGKGGRGCAGHTDVEQGRDEEQCSGKGRGKADIEDSGEGGEGSGKGRGKEESGEGRGKAEIEDSGERGEGSGQAEIEDSGEGKEGSGKCSGKGSCRGEESEDSSGFAAAAGALRGCMGKPAPTSSSTNCCSSCNRRRRAIRIQLQLLQPAPTSHPQTLSALVQLICQWHWPWQV